MGNSDGPPRDDTPHTADFAEREQQRAVELYQPPAAVTQRNETSAAVLAARVQKEIEARTIIAAKSPRSLVAVRSALLAVCEGFRFADAAMYEKPVGDRKTATGLSIRFAEEAGRQFRNLDVAVVIISEDDERRVLEGVSVDLETNYIQRSAAIVSKYVERKQPRPGDEVMGSRTNSRGATVYKIRANDDALHTATQAAAAKLRRDVILLMIPWYIKEECEEVIERTVAQLGDKDPEKFIAEVIRLFGGIGIAESELEKFLGKKPSQMNVTEARYLRRVHQGIRQGEGTWAEVIGAKQRETEGATESSATTTAPTEKPKGAGDKLRQAVKPEPKSEPSAEAPPAAPPAPSAEPKAPEFPCRECGASKAPHRSACPFAD